MKKTLITIGLTTVVVLTLVGLVSSLFGRRVNNTFSAINNSLPGAGFGGGGPELYYAEAPAAAPAYDAIGAPMEQTVNRAVSVEMAANQTSVDVNRLVIKNANLSIVVKDPKADMERIGKLANELGGYVVTSNLSKVFVGAQAIEVPQAYIKIRVPAAKLDEVLETLKSDAVDVQYETTDSQDVTSDYVDLQSRLSVKQDAEKQLLKIMETAEKADDVLAIYMQVQNIQTEIEVLKGQIKYYEESAALSAVEITLIAEAGTQPIEVGGWKIEGTAKEAIQDLVFFVQEFTRFLITFFLNYIWQFLIIALLFYVIYRIGRALVRRFVKPTAVVEVKVEEKK